MMLCVCGGVATHNIEKRTVTLFEVSSRKPEDMFWTLEKRSEGNSEMEHYELFCDDCWKTQRDKI